jgi:hypothetical protein
MPAMEGGYDGATCAVWPLVALLARSAAPAARDDTDAPFAASVGVTDAAVGRERRLLLLVGLRELEGRAAVPGAPVLA